MALFLLQNHRQEAITISRSLNDAVANITNCVSCRNLADSPTCQICTNTTRSNGQLCVVETAEDLVAVEETATFSGRYFVLHGLLSPVDDLGPKELGLDRFLPHVLEQKINEVILALNATVEGEATAHFIRELLIESNIRVTQIAHGIPVGGELGYVNNRTIAQAFERRVELRD